MLVHYIYVARNVVKIFAAMSDVTIAVILCFFFFYDHESSFFIYVSFFPFSVFTIVIDADFR